MLTIDHRPVQMLVILGLMLAAGLLTFNVVNKSPRLLRVPLRIVAVLLVVSSGVLLLVDGCMRVTTDTKADAPIYSPDRRRAVVVRRWDAGPLGGSATYINLYSYGGLREETIAGSEWSDEVAVRWNTNSEVQLQASPSGFYACNNAGSVRVTCSGAASDRPDVK